MGALLRKAVGTPWGQARGCEWGMARTISAPGLCPTETWSATGLGQKVGFFFRGSETEDPRGAGAEERPWPFLVDLAIIAG